MLCVMYCCNAIKISKTRGGRQPSSDVHERGGVLFSFHITRGEEAEKETTPTQQLPAQVVKPLLVSDFNCHHIIEEGMVKTAFDCAWFFFQRIHPPTLEAQKCTQTPRHRGHFNISYSMSIFLC